MSPTKDLSFNSMYAAFEAVPESRILSPEVIGLTDDAVYQLRQAAYNVGTGAMTVDDAVVRKDRASVIDERCTIETVVSVDIPMKVVVLLPYLIVL